jgi:hypothetical protein
MKHRFIETVPPGALDPLPPTSRGWCRDGVEEAFSARKDQPCGARRSFQGIGPGNGVG